MKVALNPFTGKFDLVGTTSSGSGTISKLIEIDFGSTPIPEAEFTITDVDASPSSIVIGQIAYLAPTGKDLDELTMDAIDIKMSSGSGQIKVYIKGLEGYLHDKFKLSYYIN